MECNILFYIIRYIFANLSINPCGNYVMKKMIIMSNPTIL